ncbi:IS30 family transposase [Pediococcus argentinicus]|nr:IS30 family transposase [Pediococcus argentinicus]NKZ23196.1 IS30 family transposase [Pediococcus argentinicus]GEP20408.1 IS30 family transposase [Pediococcus argentinicus]
MTQLNSSTYTSTKHYQHLADTERGQIEALHDQGVSERSIATKLQRSPSTISRELRRGTTSQMSTYGVYHKHYFADTGKAVYQKNRSHCHAIGMMAKSQLFMQLLEKALKAQPRTDSVDSFVHRFRKTYPELHCPSTPTVYRIIDSGLSILRNTDLPKKVGRRNKKHSQHIRTNKKLLGLSIEQRPKYIDNRSQFGHWEGDLVKGHRVKSQPALLTLTERKTRYEIIIKIPDYRAQTCLEYVQSIVNGNPKLFKSITFDNGSEFSLLNQVSGTTIYFAHPYSPWERGSNENQNGLIRESIPKGLSLTSYTDDWINKVALALNTRLRKALNYHSSRYCFNKELTTSTY